MKLVAGKVTAYEPSLRDLSDKLDAVSDVMGRATSKLEAHGRAMESFESFMTVLSSTAVSLKSMVHKRMQLPVSGQLSSAEDELVAGVEFASDVLADKPPVPPKVRRAGGGPVDVKSLSMQTVLTQRAKARADELVNGMGSMVAIRRLLNDRLTLALSTACVVANAFHDSDAFMGLIVDSKMEGLRCNEAQAREF